MEKRIGVNRVPVRRAPSSDRNVSGLSLIHISIFAIDTPVTVPVPLTQPNITSLPVPPAIIDPLIYPLPRINVFDKQGISDKTIENAKDKTKNTTDDPEEKYYYHVTTPQAAASILAESKLRPGSESYVYAWDRPPARREIESVSYTHLDVYKRQRPVCAYTSDSEEEIIYGATSAVYNNYPDGDRRNHTCLLYTSAWSCRTPGCLKAPFGRI